MSSLLSEAVLVTTAGLVALPLVSRRFRRALRPNEHVRFNTTTMVAGLALLEAAPSPRVRTRTAPSNTGRG